MTEITATICRQKQSWMTAPAVKECARKETLNQCIARVFGVYVSDLTIKDRYQWVVYAKHLYRYILERLLPDDTLAGDDWRRVNERKDKSGNFKYKYKKYGIFKEYEKKRGDFESVPYWRVRFIHKHRIYEKPRFTSLNAAMSWRNMKFKKLNMTWFRYSMEEVALLSNCDRCTVIHSISECKNLMETDRIYREKCNQVIDKINKNQIILP